MRPESLEEATSYILQYQFNHVAVYGEMEDRSAVTAVYSVLSPPPGITARKDLHHARSTEVEKMEDSIDKLEKDLTVTVSSEASEHAADVTAVTRTRH
ncbi:hypothetical protein PoB_004500100 [Plakobranchus ocellatus]|uniref:Uncharacterized protein n=1 Tax=Plakobranchus ocellatus TaxID=259542 RepID=A0AAV4BHZ0_9GAST|nr:hypothetical protein PoB_004500100 [Plakobranchus ocellatus]